MRELMNLFEERQEPIIVFAPRKVSGGDNIELWRLADAETLQKLQKLLKSNPNPAPNDCVMVLEVKREDISPICEFLFSVKPYPILSLTDIQGLQPPELQALLKDTGLILPKNLLDVTNIFIEYRDDIHACQDALYEAGYDFFAKNILKIMPFFDNSK